MKRMFTLSDSIRNFFRRQSFPQSGQQRGTIMTLTAVAMVGLLGMMALAIDLGYLFSAQTQIQNGVNAAALAAGAGLRVTIEPDPKAPEQTKLAETFAGTYGGLNELRLLKISKPEQDPPDKDPKDDAQTLTANMEVKVEVDPTTDIPSVRVKTKVRTPTLFAGAFGLQSIRIGSEATASLLPVEGGTGTIASGSGSGGCWRPLFFPDTFYDSSNTATIVGDSGFGYRRPTESSDYYRSRFAGGARASNPFFVDPPGGGPFVTGLRDTHLESDVGSKTIMGQIVYFRPQYFRIANFSGLRRDQSNHSMSSLGDVIRSGYCGQIRVGDNLPIYQSNDQSAYDLVKRELTQMRQDFGDFIEPDPERFFHYVQSSGYPAPNTHTLILPVLLYNPMIWRVEADAEAATELVVTNFGLFFLKEVTLQGELRGYFVREIIAGGAPIAPVNMSVENASPEFRRRYLPMSVQLIPNIPKP